MKPEARQTEVYKITCLVTGKSYIGITVRGTRVRWNNHASNALRANPAERIIPLLWKAIRKYGKSAFVVETLYSAGSRAEAERLEVAYIASHGTLAPHGMNLTTGGEGTPGFKRPHSDATKKKIQAAHQGRIWSAEHRKRAAEGKRGVKASAEARYNMAQCRIGKKHSQQWNANIAAGHLGKKFPKRSLALLATGFSGGRPSSTGHRGVIPEGASTWTARIGINGRRVHLGTFKTIEEASAAYQAAVAKRTEELLSLVA